jgi:hypothetical protein
MGSNRDRQQQFPQIVPPRIIIGQDRTITVSEKRAEVAQSKAAQ